MAVFSAGAAREVITPPVGARLYGYTPDVISTCVNDDLTVTAIAFSQGENIGIIISATVCLIETPLSDEIRQKAAEAAGVPARQIILCCTHTHSGPCMSGNAGWGPVDRDYCDSIFIPQTLKAVKTAVNGLQPALAGVASVKSKVGINRRQLNKDNTVSLGQNPWGCYDPNMTVISFKSLSGEAIANIVHYGAHCTAAGKNTEITRDWAGAMIDRLDSLSGAVTAFLNDAEGDTGPRISNGLTVGNLDYVNELGAVAAGDVQRAYESIDGYGEVDFEFAAGAVNLPFAPVLPLEKAKSRLAVLDVENRINIAGRTAEYLESVVKAYETGLPQEKYFTYPQTVFKVGSVVFIPMPFEIFSEISLRLRAYSPFEHTLCLGCTNGNNGYLPSEDQFCRGGYEIDVFRTSGVLTLAENTDYNIILENLKLLEDFKCTE